MIGKNFFLLATTTSVLKVSNDSLFLFSFFLFSFSISLSSFFLFSFSISLSSFFLSSLSTLSSLFSYLFSLSLFSLRSLSLPSLFLFLSFSLLSPYDCCKENYFLSFFALFLSLLSELEKGIHASCHDYSLSTPTTDLDLISDEQKKHFQCLIPVSEKKEERRKNHAHIHTRNGEK